jgi:hypothetical protein
MNTMKNRLASAMISLLLLTIGAAAQNRTVPIRVDFGKRLGPMEIDKVSLGQGGLSPDPMYDNRIAEIRALHPRLIRLFIQEYFDLLPEKGRYHWESLDRSVDLITATGASPLMCIAFKPKSLFPTVDHRIVEPNDYAAWEKLIYALVKHYKDRGTRIQYWEVGNEPDIGEDGGCPYLFTPETYVRYYQHTINAILRADPAAKVGGPALANYRSPILPALLDYCEKQKAPLHFVSWHIYSSEPQKIRATVEAVKKMIAARPSLKPETFLDEWNMSLGEPDLDPRFQPGFLLESVWQMKDAGLDYSCYYHIRDYHVDPQIFARFFSANGVAFMSKWWNRMPQFDGLFDFQNRIRPAYFAFKLLSRLRGERLALESEAADVHGLAAYDDIYQSYNILVWNFSNSPAHLDLTLDGAPGAYTMRRLLLDAAGPSDDENERLRWQTPFARKVENARISFDLDAYGVSFLTLEVRK